MSQPENPVFTPEYDQLRDVLVRIRKAAGVSQSELAARMGRNSTHVTLLERGQRRVDILEFFRLTSALGHDPAEAAREVFERFRAVKSEAAASVR